MRQYVHKEKYQEYYNYFLIGPMFHFKEEDISLMIKRLGPAKAHDCGNISIKMIKICSESLTTSLRIKFKHSLKEDRF